MKKLQADRVVKAILDQVDVYEEIAELAGVDPEALVEHTEVLDRAIQLVKGFYKYGHENMKPTSLPPPPNPYLDRQKDMEDQSAEYFAFEAIQRNGPKMEGAVETCSKLGLEAEVAEKAIENICIPWREENGWRSYASRASNGRFILMDKTPVKIKRHLDRVLEQLS